MMHLAGVHVMMGVLGYPQTKMYWQRDTEVPIISKCMSRDRFFELRNFMHFVDNQGEHEGPLWKVKPFLDCVKQKCLSLPRSKHVSLDEQMVPFSGKCGFRQFVPSKPNPLGLKNFILAAPDGLVLDFMFYTGAGTVSIEDQKEYGLGGAIVKVLTESIPQDKTHCVYTDRVFTSVKSVDMLLQRNIYQIGTVMKNRVGSVSQKLKTDKELKRGEWEECVREDEKMCIVNWKDNRSVLLLSSCVGSEPPTTCKRWSKEEKKKVVIPQSLIVKYYNEKMGGVDLCDRFMSYYRCYIRTNKWPVRMFNHFVDLIIVNCWIMYHRWCAGSGIIRQKRLSLMDYKMHVGKALINFKDIGYINIRKRGRPPSASTNPIVEDDSEDDMDKQGYGFNAFILHQAYPDVEKMDSLDFMKKLEKSLVYPQMCRRLTDLKILPHELTFCMRRILQIDDEQEQPELSKFFEVRKTFYFCDPKLKRRTKYRARNSTPYFYSVEVIVRHGDNCKYLRFLGDGTLNGFGLVLRLDAFPDAKPMTRDITVFTIACFCGGLSCDVLNVPEDVY
ncbi:piggyBac transposable element-derived protein 3-like [Anabrus simplex]|uniref:piggyBac transposable element-derived protein 3-like n=1 Tax=Anabrus simplex TaxID=316456 RepID=UPI0035A2792B